MSTQDLLVLSDVEAGINFWDTVSIMIPSIPSTWSCFFISDVPVNYLNELLFPNCNSDLDL